MTIEEFNSRAENVGVDRETRNLIIDISIQTKGLCSVCHRKSRLTDTRSLCFGWRARKIRKEIETGMASKELG